LPLPFSRQNDSADGAYFVFAKVKHTSAILDPNMTNNTAMRSGAIIVGSGAGAKEPVAGCFDGDGKADLVLYNTATTTWLFRLSSLEYAQFSIAF
jgi:hypothetical protein